MSAGGSEQIDQVKLILIEGIAKKVRAQYDTQREAALDLQVHEGVISRLCAGTYERFSIAYLINLAHKLGAEIGLTVD